MKRFKIQLHFLHWIEKNLFNIKYPNLNVRATANKATGY